MIPGSSVQGTLTEMTKSGNFDGIRTNYSINGLFVILKLAEIFLYINPFKEMVLNCNETKLRLAYSLFMRHP